MTTIHALATPPTKNPADLSTGPGKKDFAWRAWRFYQKQQHYPVGDRAGQAVALGASGKLKASPDGNVVPAVPVADVVPWFDLTFKDRPRQPLIRTSGLAMKEAH